MLWTFIYLWLATGAVGAVIFWYEGNERQFDFNRGWLAFCLALIVFGPFTLAACIAEYVRDKGSTKSPRKYDSLTEWTDDDLNMLLRILRR